MLSCVLWHRCMPCGIWLVASPRPPRNSSPRSEYASTPFPHEMAGQAQLASLDRLATSRQSGSRPITMLLHETDDRGRPKTTVQCATAPDSPLSALLLSAFQEATTPSARSQAGQGLLPRCVEIAVAQAPRPPQPSGGSGAQQPNGGASQQQEDQGLTIRVTATEAAAEVQGQEAARLLEASARSQRVQGGACMRRACRPASATEMACHCGACQLFCCLSAHTCPCARSRAFSGAAAGCAT